MNEFSNMQSRIRTERRYALDAVRGIAALAVAIYHFLYYGAGVHIQSMGTFTVYLFFSLSALTMMMVYGQSYARSIHLDDTLSFFRNRLARILPLLALVALVNVALARTAGTAVQGALMATGLFAFGPPGFLSLGNGAWTLGIELAFYAVFPVVALVVGRLDMKGLIALFVAAAGAQQAYLWLISPWLESDPLRHWHYYVVPLTFAPFFVIGFIVHRTGDDTSRGWFVPLLLGLAALASASWMLPGELLGGGLAYLMLTLLTGLVLYMGWRAEVPDKLKRAAEFLGEISYSLYLTHWFFFLAMRKASEALELSLLSFLGLFLASSVIGAWASYRLYERPMRRFFRARRVPGA